MKNFLLLFIFLHFSILVFSQPITVSPFQGNNSAVVKDLLKNSNTGVYNVQFTAENYSYGVFDAANSGFPLQSGIILSTGYAISAMGPNDQNSVSHSFTTYGQYPPLNLLINDIAYDVAKLSFDIISCSSSYSLSLVFASEEYPGSSNFEDVCGVFVTGANPSGGSYINQNFALIPGTTDYISVVNVNSAVNSTYYIDNGNGSTPSNEALQYNGYTVVLNVNIPIVPGQLYHIQVAIGDGSDNTVDSGVLFCASPDSSINDYSASLETNYGYPNELFEGIPAHFHFEKTNSLALNNSLVVHLSVDTSMFFSATYGLDYDMIPDSIIIPAGSMQYDLPLNIINDGIQDGGELFNIEMFSDCEYNLKRFETIIYDEYILDAGIEQNWINKCEGEDVLVTTFANSSDSILSYLWSNGSTDSNLYIASAFTDTTTYYVTITHDNGTFLVDSVLVTVFPAVNASLQIISDVCNYDSIDLQVTGGQTPYYYHWSTGSYYEDLSNLLPGLYIVTVTDANGCKNILSAEIVTQGPILSNITTQSSCFDSIGSIVCDINGGNSPYTTLWNTGDTVLTLDSLLGGDYFITITDSIGCVAIDSVVDFIPLPLSVELSYPSTGCFPGYAGLNITGTNSPFITNWSTGSNSSNIIVNNAGTYWYSVEDAAGCFLSDTFTYVPDTSISMQVSSYLFIDSCSILPNYIDLTIDSAAYPVSFLWSNGETTEDIYDLQAGYYYNVTVVDANSCFDILSFYIPHFPDLNFFINSYGLTNCQLLNNGLLCSC